MPISAESNLLRDEALKRFPPLVHEHYYFGLTEAVQRGEPRALRDPRNGIQEL